MTFTAVAPGRTRLELEHIGDVPQDFWDTYGPGATGIGWDLGLLGLARHLDDPAARIDEAAFSASTEGRRFITESGEGWYAAALAGGLDERAQRAAADRSIAFYTPAT